MSESHLSIAAIEVWFGRFPRCIVRTICPCGACWRLWRSVLRCRHGLSRSRRTRQSRKSTSETLTGKTSRVMRGSPLPKNGSSPASQMRRSIFIPCMAHLNGSDHALDLLHTQMGLQQPSQTRRLRSPPLSAPIQISLATMPPL